MKTPFRMFCFVTLALSLFAATKAAAITLPECGAGGPCGGTANPIYAEDTFYGAANHDIFVVSPPFVIDQSLNDAAGSGRGIVDLSTGILKASATAASSSPQFTTTATGNDLFNLGGLTPGSLASVSATLTANGFILVTQEGASAQTHAFLSGSSIPSSFDGHTYQGFSNPSGSSQVPLNTLVPISLTTTDTFSVTVGTPFDLAYALRLDTNYGTQLDFLSTAQLSFTLPQGATISSQGGFSVVPLPAAVWLFGSGLLGLVGVARRKKMHTMTVH